MNKYIVRYNLGWLHGSKFVPIEGALDNDYLYNINVPPKVCADIKIDDLYYVFETNTLILTPFCYE